MRSTTSVLLALYECLHHLQAKSRWYLMVLLSGWIGGPRLEPCPWQFADGSWNWWPDVPPTPTESCLHGSHNRYLLAADSVQSRVGGDLRCRWLGLHCLLNRLLLLLLLLQHLLSQLLWDRSYLRHLREPRQREHSTHEHTPEGDHNHRFAQPRPIGKRPAGHGVLWGESVPYFDHQRGPETC